MYHGIINIYKEKGFTSHDVVARLRGILKQKKIGHTGTLDPDATGVLPVCLGKGTKLCDLLTDKEKAYVAEMELGFATDTQDISGTVTDRADISIMGESITDDVIRQTIMSFVGEYGQIPPMYSAIKVNGKRLYEMARKGMEIERQPRPVKIIDIDILEINYPKIKIKVSCSKGTYIRTLCHDIGIKLGTYGCMTSLERVKSGMFEIDTAMTLSQVENLVKEDRLSEVLVPVDRMFLQYQAVVIPETQNKLLYNGNSIYSEDTNVSEEQLVRVYDSNEKFIGIYKMTDGFFKPEKLFLEQ